MVDKPSSDLPAAVLYELRNLDMRGLFKDGPPLPVLKPLRAGDLCPRCKTHRLDYDGMLNLACPACGVREAGCFT
jgi:hypothetical protein